MPSKRLVRALVVGALLLLADQVAQYTVLADGRLFGRRVIPYDPPLFTDWQWESAREVAAIAAGDEATRARSIFDPELGWCPRPGQDLGLYQHDWAGCRIQLGPLAREKASGVRRVVTVGCSFTQGAEVAGSETWSAWLDQRRPELEVANLGVAGYGVDQALLRFRRDGAKLAPDEVWLGFMPGSTLRITSQFPPAFAHWASVLTFKPLFTLGPGDELCLVPSPARDFAAYDRLLSDQRAFVEALSATDRWVRRAPAAFAPRGSSWTHWFALTRLCVTWSEMRGREPAPYLRDSEGEVYRLLRALVLELARGARAGGARFRLVVLPSRADLCATIDAGDPYWTPLLGDLARRGIECVDVTPALLGSPMVVEDRFWMPNEHYSSAGNRVVADALEPLLAGD